MELRQKNRLSLPSPTFSVSHTPHIACTPQGEDEPPWILCLKKKNHLHLNPFYKVLTNPERQKSPSPLTPCQNTLISLAQMSILCDKGFWAQQMKNCQTLLPLSTIANPLNFLYKVKSFHITTSTAVGLPANLLSGKPRSFIPCSRERKTHQIHSIEVCKFSLYPKTWNYSHWIVKWLEEKKVSLDSRLSVTHAEVIPHRGQCNEEFFGTLKILMLLCSASKPLTSAPCAKCVSDKQRRGEASSPEGRKEMARVRESWVFTDFQRVPALAAGSGKGVTAIARRCQRQECLFAGFQAVFRRH